MSSPNKKIRHLCATIRNCQKDMRGHEKIKNANYEAA
jgi:hypothetical protein